jgi:multiple sugar transport system substrate-binding protein
MRSKIAGLVAMALLSAGCGDDDNNKQPSTKLAGTITVAAAGGEGEIKALQGVADAFMTDNPGTKVTLDTVEGAGDLISKLTTAFAAQSAPDVFVLNYRRLGGFAARGVIEPVPSGGTDGMYDEPLEAFTFDGKLLCRPSNASSMVVYYNTELFAQAGVDVPSADWTWDDLRSTATALKAKGVSSIGFETALIRLAPFVWSNGGEIVDDVDEPTTVDLSSPEAKEAIQLLLDLQKSGMSATDRAAQDPEEAFTAGKVAMYLDSRRAVPGFRKTEGLAFDVAPVPTKKESVSVLHSDGYCVTKAGKNKALAEAFAAYATTGAGASVLAKSGRTVPVKKSIAESTDFLSPEAPKSSQVWLDQVDAARPLPHTPTWNEAEGVTEEILTQLFAGKLGLDEAIADIAAQTKVELAKA